MDFFSILETFGLPVAMVIALGFYISKKDKSAEKEIEEPYAEGTEVVEEASTDKIIKLLKLLDKH